MEAEHGRTPLFNATDEGNYEQVKLLLENGADANDAEWVHSRSCLHNAAYSGNRDVVKLLLEYGARMDEDDMGNTPLDCAGLAGDTEIVKLLGPDPQLLIHAVWSGNLELVKKLYEDGVRLTGESSHLTIEQKSEMFIDGHDFSKEDPAGILVHAVNHQQFEMVRYLLERGEDPNKMDEMGRLAIDIAIKKKNKEIATLLVEYGVKMKLENFLSPLW
uniref:Uncharacterized protein n=1 Tax=viral metagenome TaxID=1070528 RepID=A0A6C0BAD0_9ZZZZ